MRHVESVLYGLSAVAAAALLGSCGGGGGGGEPRVVIPADVRVVAATAGSDLVANSLATQGNWLGRAVLSTSSDNAFDITADREQPQARRDAPRRAGSWLMPAAVVKAVVRAASPRFGVREAPAALGSETMACSNPGGSMTFTVDDADEDEQVTAGDAITIEATNCVLDPTIPAANGTMRLALNAVELGSDDELRAVDASVTLGNFSLGDYGTYNGSMRLWIKPDGASERARVRYEATSITLRSLTLVFDFDAVAVTTGAQTRFDLNGGLGVGGQTYAIVAGETMSAVAPDPPSAGWLRLRDGAGDEVRLTARTAASFDLDFRASGASAPSASLPGVLWADVLPSR